MSSSRPFVLVLLVALLLAGHAPFLLPGAAQAQQYCPAGDSGTGPPAGTPAQAVKAVFNLAVGDILLSMTPAGATNATNGTIKGEYTVFNETGQLNVTAFVRRVGTAAPPGGATTVDVRITVGKPDGSTLLQTRTVGIPTAANPSPATALFSVGPGRHTVFVDVNPNRTPAETCTDSAPNTNCQPGGVPQACTYTYYNNNRRTVGMIAQTLPDLRVVGISVDGPDRATAAANADSVATVRVTVENAGTGAAFNLSALNPGARPFQVRVTVVDCSCPARLLNINQLAAGAETTVSGTFAVHGLRDTMDVSASLDPRDWVVESDGTNDVTNLTFDLPTPDIVASGRADLPLEGTAFVVPKGRDLDLEVTVANPGNADAEGPAGGAFRVTVHQDSADADADLLLDNQLRLPGLGSSSYAIRVPAAELTGSHTFTIQADRGNQVFESTEANNNATIRVVVAVYQAQVIVAQGDRSTTVPPGITGHIPFTLKNTGTVSDTYDFEAPSGLDARQRYSDAEGNPVTEIHLAAGATFKGEVEFDINSTDAKDKRFSTEVVAKSRTLGDSFTQAVAFVVGEDTVAPTITLEEPSTGFLSGNNLIVKIRDNVAVRSAETDLSGSFSAITPTTTNGTLYDLDVTGRPNRFSFTVRATDEKGNSATQTFEIVRDTTRPRIVSATFTPEAGLTPGATTVVLVRAEDANMDRVEVHITQQRPAGILYEERHTLTFAGGSWRLSDWVVPERPGFYRFNFTAYDKAGNTVDLKRDLIIRGLDIFFASPQPIVSDRTPQVGDRITFTYTIGNSHPTLSTGRFAVGFIVDSPDTDARQIARPTFDLAGGQRLAVPFTWIVEPGPHEFGVVLDQGEEVWEDTEGAQGANVLVLTTEILFPGYALFAGDGPEELGFLSFGERVQRYWYMPAMLVAAAVLFVIATVLKRRPFA